MNQPERGDLCLILALPHTGSVSLDRNPVCLNFLSGKKKKVDHRVPKVSPNSNIAVCMR